MSSTTDVVEEIKDFSSIISIDEIIRTDASLHVTKYVTASRLSGSDDTDLKPFIYKWFKESELLRERISITIKGLK